MEPDDLDMYSRHQQDNESDVCNIYIYIKPSLINTLSCITYYVPSQNNSRLGDYPHRIYLNKLEIKDTTDTQKSASYLDVHIQSDS